MQKHEKQICLSGKLDSTKIIVFYFLNVSKGFTPAGLFHGLFNVETWPFNSH